MAEQSKKDCVLCDGMPYEQFKQEIRKTISAAGLQIIGVQGSGTSTFTYTIGVSEKYGFELICIGLPSKYAASIFNAIVLDYLPVEGNSLQLDIAYDRWTNLPCMFKECSDELAREYAIQAFEYYQGPLRLVQMVISDREGRLPNDPAFDHAYMGKVQRLLF